MDKLALSFVVGAVVAFLALSAMTSIYGIGAQKACQNIIKAECELVWVPVSRSNGD